MQIRQQAIIVGFANVNVAAPLQPLTPGLQELNTQLSFGWRVVSVHPMAAAATSGGQSALSDLAFAALIIIEQVNS